MPRYSDKSNFSSLNDIEHALHMYATSYCTIPAESIYDSKLLSRFESVIKKCHIYIIGFTPIIELIYAELKPKKLILVHSILGENYQIEIDVPEGFNHLKKDDYYYMENECGEQIWPDETYIQKQLSLSTNAVTFEVKYIGQAFGKEGERNALDRLIKHETLQKIALKGAPQGYKLTLLMLEVLPANRIFTFMNPTAKNKDSDSSRINAGLDMLYGTTEQQRISLYEAALIRYFYPEYNTEYKDSFPSTNLKILQTCYEKDFAGIVAEICFDELPFNMFSETISISNYHIAKHHLHNEKERKIFFGV